MPSTTKSSEFCVMQYVPHVLSNASLFPSNSQLVSIQFKKRYESGQGTCLPLFLRWLYYLPLFHKLLPLPSSRENEIIMPDEHGGVVKENYQWKVSSCTLLSRHKVFILSSPGSAWRHACDINMYEWKRQYHYHFNSRILIWWLYRRVQPIT